LVNVFGLTASDQAAHRTAGPSNGAANDTAYATNNATNNAAYAAANKAGHCRRTGTDAVARVAAGIACSGAAVAVAVAAVAVCISIIGAARTAGVPPGRGFAVVSVAGPSRGAGIPRKAVGNAIDVHP
jgi:hypothetical protein